MRRACTKCRNSLTGRKGHGFVTKDGRGVECGPCAYPQKPITKGARK